MRTRPFVATAAVALATLAAGTAPAAAEADHSNTLRTICEANGGTFVPGRFWRARCQGSSPSGGVDDGLRAPFMICTMQMAGAFFSSVIDEDGSTSWVCL